MCVCDRYNRSIQIGADANLFILSIFYCDAIVSLPIDIANGFEIIPNDDVFVDPVGSFNKNKTIQDGKKK